MKILLYIYQLLPLSREAYAECNDDIRPRLYVLMKCYEEEGPLTGLGYFEVGRSCLLAILSTVINYFIIMFQFRLDTNTNN